MVLPNDRGCEDLTGATSPESCQSQRPADSGVSEGGVGSEGGMHAWVLACARRLIERRDCRQNEA